MLAGIAMLFIALRRPRTRYRSDAPGAIVNNRRTDANRFQSTVDRSLIAMEETAREVAAKLDTRIRLLDGHVRAADQASARLEQLVRRAAEVNGQKPVASVPDEPMQEQPATESASEPAGKEPGEAESTSDDQSSSTSKAQVTASQPSERSLRVHELADRGTSALDIAHNTGIPVGEVKLIMGLRDADRLTAVGDEPPSHEEPR